jgi:hypothetical protein
VILRGNLSPVTIRLLRFDAPNALRTELPPAEFPDAASVAGMLTSAKYFAPSPSGDAVVSAPRGPAVSRASGCSRPVRKQPWLKKHSCLLLAIHTSAV